MRKTFVICAVIAVALAALGAAARAGRAQSHGMTWKVAIGGETPDHGVQANVFAPGTITVNAGDAVTWTMASLYDHTVTFLSGAPQPPLAVPQKDGRLLLPPLVAFPQGRATYAGRGVASSGVLQGKGKSYSLTFTRPGRYSYVCLLHPGQTGTVIVVPLGRTLPHTQRQYDTLAATQASGAVEQGARALASAKAMARKSGSATSYTLSLIASPSGRAAVDRFSPETLTVKAGDTVRWVMKDPSELHTVTFSGAAPPPDFLLQEPQAKGPPKIYFNPKIVAPAGGRTHAAGPYYNSGLMTVGDPGTVKSYALTFTKPGTYTYWCVVHVPQGMKGTIVVQ